MNTSYIYIENVYVNYIEKNADWQNVKLWGTRGDADSQIPQLRGMQPQTDAEEVLGSFSREAVSH